ncbi:MAG: acyltransferase family protein [Desulfobacteraceae bacterium]|nr:acyltransferase family protein [Desulfobacteraceae bacterium]MBC2756717.1 acyltransferase family protein [Desulfobacteraceae bacterium]
MVKPVKGGRSNKISRILSSRTEKWSVEGPNVDMMKRHSGVWDFILDHYFRVEMTGWERLPDKASMLIGIHSGTWLTMDAWTLCAEWWRRYQGERILHGTAHDALMAMPVLGQYFHNVGVIPAKRESVTAAFAAGHDVVIWPGGEVDAMRSWSKRYDVVLGGRTGFIRQAIRSGVPIVPIATVGGHDTVFVLSECRKLAKILRLKKYLRTDIAPLVLGFPFGITLEAFPMHIPYPAKIRTEILEPIEIDTDPEREKDNEYVDKKYKEVESCIQEGVNRLAGRRKGPVFG